MIKLFSKDTFNINGVLLDFVSNFDVSCLSKHDCILLTEDYTFIDAFNEQLGVTNSLVVWKSNSLKELMDAGTSLKDFFTQCLAYKSQRDRDLVIYAEPADVANIVWGFLKAIYPLAADADLGNLYDAYKTQLASIKDSIPAFKDLTDTALKLNSEFLPPEAHAVLPIEYQYADHLIRGEQSQLSYTFWTTLTHMVSIQVVAKLKEAQRHFLNQNYRLKELTGEDDTLEDLINDPNLKTLWSQTSIGDKSLGASDVLRTLDFVGAKSLVALCSIVSQKDFAKLSASPWFNLLTGNGELHLHGALLSYFQSIKGTDQLKVYGV